MLDHLSSCITTFTSVYAEDNGVMVPDLDENGDLQWAYKYRYFREDAQVQAIAMTWTNDVKNNFKTFKEAQEAWITYDKARELKRWVKSNQ